MSASRVSLVIVADFVNQLEVFWILAFHTGRFHRWVCQLEGGANAAGSTIWQPNRVG